MTKKEFDSLDDSINSFERIKVLSEERWKDVVHSSSSSGGVYVKGLKWKKGLSELEIEDFENQLGHKFPEALKNYYRVMNGLEIINEDLTHEAEEPFYKNLFRVYPEDINWIINNAELECVAFNLSKEHLGSYKVPMIFNYSGNRYLIFDENKQVLSIRGDTIFFAENLSKGLAKDIFNDFMDTKKEDLLKYKVVNGWLEKKY